MSPCSIPHATHSILLYHCSALKRLLLADVIGQRAAMFCTSLCPQLIPSYIYKKLVPKPMPDTSVSKYKGSDA